MRALRKSIKNAIKPDQALVDKFAAVFLAGKPCGFTIDDVMKEAEAAQALIRVRRIRPLDLATVTRVR